MPCPCGLTKEELRELGFVNDWNRCTALFEDESGNEYVCGKHVSSHPSQQGNVID